MSMRSLAIRLFAALLLAAENAQSVTLTYETSVVLITIVYDRGADEEVAIRVDRRGERSRLFGWTRIEDVNIDELALVMEG